VSPRGFSWSAAAAALLLALAACRAPVAGPGEAECPVCRCEGDLACLVVRVEADTPRTTLAGVTYHFCSDACRARFEADPQAFLPR